MIVAVAGVKGSGKTTAADIFINQGYILINFADMLKDFLMETHGFTYGEMYDPLLKELPNAQGLVPRKMMQETGDLFKNQYGDSVFANHVVSTIQKNRGNYVVGDLRYPIEFEKLQKAGAIFIYVNRQVDENYLSNHSSEQEVKNLKNRCDHIVENNGSKIDFLCKISTLSKSLKKTH